MIMMNLSGSLKHSWNFFNLNNKGAKNNFAPLLYMIENFYCFTGRFSNISNSKVRFEFAGIIFPIA